MLLAQDTTAHYDAIDALTLLHSLIETIQLGDRIPLWDKRLGVAPERSTYLGVTWPAVSPIISFWYYSNVAFEIGDRLGMKL